MLWRTKKRTKLALLLPSVGFIIKGRNYTFVSSKEKCQIYEPLSQAALRRTQTFVTSKVKCLLLLRRELLASDLCVMCKNQRPLIILILGLAFVTQVNLKEKKVF